MPLETRAIVGIAVSAAFVSFVLTASLFLLLRRHEEFVRAKKEAEMAPIVREKKSYHYWARRQWVEDYDEYSLMKNGGYGEEQFDKKWIINYLGGVSVINFYAQFGIPRDAPPINLGTTDGNGNGNGNVQASYDISAALSHYFDGQLELGIDHRIITRLLFHTNYLKRETGIEFLIHKAALSFFNLQSNPKYSILPPKILALAEELRVRGPKSHDNYQDRHCKTLEDDNPNPFLQLYNRWRVLTFAMYGRTEMPAEVYESMKRRVDFLMTVLGPVLIPETLAGAREFLEKVMKTSLDLALFCADQRNLTITSWDYTDQTSRHVTYVGEPQEIPPFDMMAQKTLVVCPAFIYVASYLTDMPYVRPYAREPAKLVKFKDAEWEELTKDL